MKTVYGRPSRVSGPAGSSSRLPDGTTRARCRRAQRGRPRPSSSAALLGLEAGGPDDRAGAGRGGQPRQQRRRGSPRVDGEPRAAPAQLRVERRQRARQPPARRPRPAPRGGALRGSHTKTGSRRPAGPAARAAASASAGLSARRRSRRSHSSDARSSRRSVTHRGASASTCCAHRARAV